MMLLMAAGGTPQAVPDPRPVVADPIVMQMRPSARPLRTFRIAQDGTGDFTTFGAAIAAGTAVQAAALTAAGLQPSQITPNFRIDYLTGPGVHTVAPGTWDGVFGDFHAFYATDTTRGATRLEWGIAPGAGLYWEGIDITNVDNDGRSDPKYPLHLRAGVATVITRCTLDNAAPASGGGLTTIGTDGSPNATVVVHDVTLRSSGTNQHGWPTTTTGHQTIVYSNVTCPNGHVNWGAGNDIAPDEVWVVGGSTAGVDVGGAATILHLDPATILTGPVTTTGTTDSRTDWPIPVGGLSAHDRAHFGM